MQFSGKILDCYQNALGSSNPEWDISSANFIPTENNKGDESLFENNGFDIYSNGFQQDQYLSNRLYNDVSNPNEYYFCFQIIQKL